MTAAQPTPAPPLEAVLTVRDAAAKMRQSERRIRELIASGELGYINDAGPRSRRRRILILPEHIRDYWARKNNPAIT